MIEDTMEERQWLWVIYTNVTATAGSSGPNGMTEPIKELVNAGVIAATSRDQAINKVRSIFSMKPWMCIKVTDNIMMTSAMQLMYDSE